MPKEQQTENPFEEQLFNKMAKLPPEAHSKKIQRSKNNVVLTGVCSGIADYLKLDVANIRLIAVLSILLGGWSVAAYFITALLLPVDKNPKELTARERSALQKENFRTVLSGLFILTGLHYAFMYIGIGSGERFFILPNGFIFPIVAITAGIFFLTRNDQWYEGYDHLKKENYFRSRADKKIMGVCGGLAEYVNIDSSTLRIIFILATLLTFGMFAIIYLFLGVFTQLESRQRFE